MPVELPGVYRYVLGKNEGSYLAGVAAGNSDNETEYDKAMIAAVKKIVEKPAMWANSIGKSPNLDNAQKPYRRILGGRPSVLQMRGNTHPLKNCPTPFTPNLMWSPKKGLGEGSMANCANLTEGRNEAAEESSAEKYRSRSQ